MFRRVKMYPKNWSPWFLCLSVTLYLSFSVSLSLSYFITYTKNICLGGGKCDPRMWDRQSVVLLSVELSRWWQTLCYTGGFDVIKSLAVIFTFFELSCRCNLVFFSYLAVCSILSTASKRSSYQDTLIFIISAFFCL